MRKLVLTLKKEWFDLIRSGKKTVEYREYKPYWISRLVGKDYDYIEFRNGYGKEAPVVRSVYEGFKILAGISNPLNVEKVFAIPVNYRECERCGEYRSELYCFHYKDELTQERKDMMVCWDCDFEIINNRGEVNQDSYSIMQDRCEEAYENDPINEPYPY